MKLKAFIAMLVLLVGINANADIIALKHNTVGTELTQDEYHADAYGETGVHEGNASPATIIVAASDSVDKQKADYVDGSQLVCDGTADQVEVQAAVDAVHAAGGGTVVLLPGNYSFNSSLGVRIDDNTTLSAYGATITLGKADLEDYLLFGGGNFVANGGTLLTCTWTSFTVDALIGLNIWNATDTSYTTITDNDATTISTSYDLFEGDENDWDVRDSWYIARTHTGSNDASVLTDSSVSYATDALVGYKIYNITTDPDGLCYATITANTATTVTHGELAGGGCDGNVDWDNGDTYVIQNNTRYVINEDTTNGNSNITIQGGTIVGNNSGYEKVAFFNSDNIVVKDMYIDDVSGTPIAFIACTEGKMVNNHVSNVYFSDTGPALSLSSSSSGVPNEDMLIEGNYIENGSGEGIDINKDDTRVTVANNIIKNIITEGIDAGGGNFVIIEGNHIYSGNTVSYGIIPPWSGKIIGNTIRGGSTAIRLSGSAFNGISIVDNYIRGCALYGIELNSNNHNHVTGNTITGCQFQGIMIDDSDYNIITGNHVSDNGLGNQNNRGGISITDSSSYNTIVGNFIGNTGDGVTATLSTNVSSGSSLVVTDAAYKFYPGQPIIVDDNDSAAEEEVVASINTTTDTLTIVGTISGTFTTAQNAVVTGRAEQGYGIVFANTSSADYNVIKNNNYFTNSRSSGLGGIHFGSGTSGTHNVYDLVVMSPEMDLSNALEDFVIYSASVPCQVMSYRVIWTEAAGDTNSATVRVGTLESDGTDDPDRYDSTGLTANGTEGMVESVGYSSMTGHALGVGDALTVGHVQKTGDGKVVIAVDLVVGAN